MELPKGCFVEIDESNYGKSKTVTITMKKELTGKAVLNAPPVLVEIDVRRREFTMYDNKTNKVIERWIEEEIL